MQTVVHYFLHFGFPLLIAFVFFRKEWGKVYILLLATMLVDIDHLFAKPIFQANRCSIGYHFLHTHYAVAVYLLMLFLPRPFNIIGIGLLFHMLTDLMDCLFMFNECEACYTDASAYEVLKAISDFIGL